MGHISIIMSVRVCHCVRVPQWVTSVSVRVCHDSCASAPMGHISIIMSVRVCHCVRVPQWVTSV